MGSILILSLNGCSFDHVDNIYIKEPDPLTKTPMYKRGYRNGCRTAKGTYTKNHYAFKHYKAYYDGWFAGRHDCNR